MFNTLVEQSHGSSQCLVSSVEKVSMVVLSLFLATF